MLAQYRRCVHPAIIAREVDDLGGTRRRSWGVDVQVFEPAALVEVQAVHSGREGGASERRRAVGSEREDGQTTT